MQKAGTTEKEVLEGRIQTLEEGMTENRGYLQRILQLVNQAAEEKDSPQSVKNQPTKCQKFFNLFGIPEEQKLEITAMYLGNDEPKNLNTGLVTKTSPLNSNVKQSLVKYRRTHNLCFKCGEKYTPGHQCKVRQLNCMEEEEDSAKKGMTEEEAGEKEDVENEALEISINAITGNVSHTTLRIQGFIKGKPLNILIDSGSTHSFVTPKWAKEGMELVNTQPLVITVANGDKLYSNAKCNKVSWKMQGYEFQHDFRVLSLGGSDMLSVEVADSITPQPLQKLLAEFSEVFEDPKGMPPKRKHDHVIILKQGSHPVNLKPYMFSYPHKDEVEKHITDMLAASIIQNKFPIPIVEDLLDELNGAAFFSKFDLRKFVLVFFDDILVYSPNLAAHEQHLRVVLNILLENKLHDTKSKCFFGQTQVEYLGHLISAQGVATNPAKIKAMQQWPLPKNLKALRGFLGLTGYYRKFIKGYGELSKPLTNMLKKKGFYWSPEAMTAFEELKQVMCRALVLASPNFEREKNLETDTSSKGIGAVISQEGMPIAYLSKALGPKHTDLSIYEKEYLAILMAKLTKAIQKKGLTKLLGLDYTIQYRKGKHNKVADALSRQQEDFGEFFQIGIAVITPTWMHDIEQSYRDDIMAQENIPILVIQPRSIEDWKLVKGVLYFKNKAYVGSKGDLREKIILALHASSIGGHSGPVEATCEDYSVLKTQFSDFNPWGKRSSGGGGIVIMEEELGLEKGEIGRKLPQLGILNGEELGILKEEELENEKIGEQITMEAGVGVGSAEAKHGPGE
ncbi:uncharacterized protein LOC120209873 [Hibiscus syriacus]|uniref:uncharacterized protein LOC120209873 n=1 Tax=Hibiscus syriacus TaxID=106335 RepID=UPI001924E00A|nr:uncharacterized protein LOC120209873 [Hibiscus syriacus]